MHCLKSTYKQFLAFTFLSIYLCSTLSIPIFEGVHFLLHLEDGAPIHSFQSHQPSHNHQILIVLNDLVAQDNTPQLPVETSKKLKIKKLVQVSSALATTKTVTRSVYSSIFEENKPLYASPYLKISAPPPKV